MDEAEKRRRIGRAYKGSRCPNCWGPIPPGKGVGSGGLADGTFCGLDCQAVFHKDYYRDRIRASRASSN